MFCLCDCVHVHVHTCTWTCNEGGRHTAMSDNVLANRGGEEE